jgi:hypothetical protein
MGRGGDGKVNGVKRSRRESNISVVHANGTAASRFRHLHPAYIANMRIQTALLGLCLVTCSDPSDPHLVARNPAPATLAALTAKPAPVVLITVDGVRWQDVYSAVDESLGFGGGYMPVLRDMVTHKGAMLGAPGHGRIDASGPNFVSMPGYTEIFTGRVPSCTDNDCGRPEHATFLEELAARGANVAVFASWEKVGQAVSHTPPLFFVSAGRPDGDTQSPFPGGGAYRPDESTMELSLSYLRDNQPDVLVISLGDTDEYAHHGNLRGYNAALTRVDQFIGRVNETLSHMGERGAATHLFVTTDHGRGQGFNDHGGKYPESGRVWLAAMGPRITSRGFVSGRAHHLRDLAGTIVAVATKDEPAPQDSLSELLAQ